MRAVQRLGMMTFSIMGIAATWSQAAAALPLGAPRLQAERDALPHPYLVDGEVDFTAIVALDDCSGSIVRFANSQPDDHALVLTNGHCYEGGFLNAGQVLVDTPSTRTFDLLSSDATSTLGTLTASSVVYATMTNTDVTLYKLTATYASIQSQYGVTALTLASEHPASGAPISVVSGYWKKIYTCSIDRFIYQLKEGDWTWSDSLLYKQPGCDTVGGTSGSPVVDTNTREVVAVNNTGNEDGEHCTLDNPCEVDASGNITVTKGASYGQETYILYGCFGADAAVDLSLATCTLPKPQ